MITVFRGVTSVSAMPGKVAGSEANVCHLDFSGQDVGDMEGVCCSRVGGDGGSESGRNADVIHGSLTACG